MCIRDRIEGSQLDDYGHFNDIDLLMQETHDVEMCIRDSFNRSSEILNAWSPTNTGSDIPRLSKNDPNGNFTTCPVSYTHLSRLAFRMATAGGSTSSGT